MIMLIKRKLFYFKYNNIFTNNTYNTTINSMLNDEGVQNHHHHQSYDEHTNWGGNSRSEDMIERVVHNSNMVGEMIRLMIHNQENMVSKAVRDQHQLDSIQNLDKQCYCY